MHSRSLQRPKEYNTFSHEEPEPYARARALQAVHAQSTTSICHSPANPGAQAAAFCFPQEDGLEKDPELNGKKDGLLQDKTESTATEKAVDIQELEARGEVSPEGQGAAQAAVEYLGAPLPPNEKERHETLCACQILDSAPDPRFDDITKLVGLCLPQSRDKIAANQLFVHERSWTIATHIAPAGVMEAQDCTYLYVDCLAAQS